MAFNYTLLYHNISPFCEPLSSVHQLDFFFFFCFAIRILHCLFHTDFRPYFLRILHCIFYTNFLCFIQVSLLILGLISIRIFLLSLLRYYMDNWTLFHTNFSLSFFAQIDYHTVYIDLCLYHIFTQIFMNFECCTLENNESDCNIRNFNAIPILQCLWLSSFSQLVLSLFLRLFIVILFLYCHQLLSYVFF